VRLRVGNADKPDLRQDFRTGGRHLPLSGNIPHFLVVRQKKNEKNGDSSRTKLIHSAK